MKKVIIGLILLGIFLSGCIEPMSEDELTDEVFTEETTAEVSDFYVFNDLECQNLEVSEIRDECYYEKSLEEETSYCDKIEDSVWRNTCYYDLAIFIWEPNYCLELVTPEEFSDIPSYSKDFCLNMYVKDSLDKEACNMIEHSGLKKTCFEYAE